MIIRVILLPNGSIHIALANRKCVVCTPLALMTMLKDPRSFFKSGYYEFDLSTMYVNPNSVALNEISGLTLLSADHENKISCVFPFLFSLLFDAISLKDAKPLYATRALLEPLLSDEKHFLLCLYLDLANQENEGYSITQRLPLSEESQMSIMREIINTHFHTLPLEKRGSEPAVYEEAPVENILLFSEETPPPSDDVPYFYVSIREYANQHGHNYQTVYNWAFNGNLRTARRNKLNKWVLDPNDLPIKCRIPKRQPKTTKRRTDFSDQSYGAVQAYILKRKIVSDSVRTYIRTYEEARYYDKYWYHEVLWNGFSALIIDINPEYECKTTGLTNRALIERGESPVVPNDEEHIFHLHHIGQREDSPVAIIPESDHLGMFDVFHQGSSEKSINRKQFDAFRRSFWNTYLQMYDKYGGFKRIPYVNKKQTTSANERSEVV